MQMKRSCTSSSSSSCISDRFTEFSSEFSAGLVNCTSKQTIIPSSSDISYLSSVELERGIWGLFFGRPRGRRGGRGPVHPFGENGIGDAAGGPAFGEREGPPP